LPGQKLRRVSIKSSPGFLQTNGQHGLTPADPLRWLRSPAHQGG
jgi:hypothetical protein